MLGQGLMLATPASAAGDPYANQNLVLLHFEGTNGSSTTTDSSPVPVTVTMTTGATISTSSPLVGTSSMVTTSAAGARAYFTPQDVQAGVDFTDEGWFVEKSDATGNHILFEHGPYNSMGYKVYTSPSHAVGLYGWNGAVNIGPTGGVTPGTPFHVAVTRENGTIKLWVNGSLYGSAAYSAGVMSGNSSVGAAAASTLIGPDKADEVRYTNGVARYTASFTPPSGAFPNTSGKTYATWNPADKAASFALSSGNLVNTTSNVAGQVRGTIGKSSGKWYWEFVLSGSITANVTGVSKTTSSVNTATGNDTSSWGYNNNGLLYTNSSGSAYGSSSVAGDVIGVALDMNAGTLVFYKNGVSMGVAATGLSGTLYPSSGMRNGGSGVVVTANFGATPFTYAPPAGYNFGLY